MFLMPSNKGQIAWHSVGEGLLRHGFKMGPFKIVSFACTRQDIAACSVLVKGPSRTSPAKKMPMLSVQLRLQYAQHVALQVTIVLVSDFSIIRVQ